MNNEYGNYRRGIHEAQHPGGETPVPHAKTWFNENTMQPNLFRRKDNGVTNNDGSGSDDEELIISKATQVLKCTFTLQYFEKPYSNDKCKHVFDSPYIQDYIKAEGTAFDERNAEGKTVKVKRARCPQSGCDAVSFYPQYYVDFCD